MLFNSLVLAASLALPLASASHGLSPRDLSLSHYRSFGRRSLPRSGRRVDRRQAGQATVKCDSRHTFSLCDMAGTCTAMGAVAPGTACENDAITWDSESATDLPADSSTNEVAVTPPPTSEVVVTPTKANLAAQGTPTSADPTFNSASPSASASSTDLTGSDDDGDCETDDVSAPDAPSTDASSSYSSSSSASTVIVVAAVQTPAPTTASPTSTPAPTPTTTSAPAPAASIPAVGAVSGIVGQTFDGFATYYYQEGGTGACGQVHQDSDLIVAIQISRYGTGSNNAPDCGRTVIVTNPANGKSVTAKVADACPGCKTQDSLDLSTGAFNAIADPALGVIPITWGFAS